MTRKAPWARNKPTVKRTRRPVKRVSAARAKQRSEYEKVRDEFLSSEERCFSCRLFVYLPCRENHHFFGRIGRLLAWVPGFRMSCKVCHHAIHANPAWAREEGLICPLGMWNNYDKALEFIRRQNSTE